MKNAIRLDNYQGIHFTPPGLRTIYDLQLEPLIVDNNLVKNKYLFIEPQLKHPLNKMNLKFCSMILFAFPKMRYLNNVDVTGLENGLMEKKT